MQMLRDNSKLTNVQETINYLGNRSAVICRRMLETICYGDEVISSTLTVNDKNRKQYYDLLMTLYS